MSGVNSWAFNTLMPRYFLHRKKYIYIRKKKLLWICLTPFMGLKENETIISWIQKWTFVIYIFEDDQPHYLKSPAISWKMQLMLCAEPTIHFTIDELTPFRDSGDRCWHTTLLCESCVRKLWFWFIYIWEGMDGWTLCFYFTFTSWNHLCCIWIKVQHKKSLIDWEQQWIKAKHRF